MGSEWPSLTVEELAADKDHALSTGPFGSAISSKFFEPTGVPVIRGSNLSQLTSDRLNDNGLVFIAPEKAEEFKRSTVRKNDLIFTCWGTINQVGIIDDNATFDEYVISNKQMKLTPNTDMVIPEFLYYVFQSPQKQDEILSNGIGSSVPGFNLGQLKAHRVDLPSLPEQKAIAHILGTLDDKIELNRRMNATLEGMAQALFKSWFVDFDPVIDNALAAGNPIPDELAPRAEVRKNALANGTTQQGSVDHPTLSDPKSQFPAAFQFTEELGWIPEGWSVAKAEDLVTRHKVKQKFTKKNALEEGPVPIFDQGAGLLLGYSELAADQDSSKENPKFIFGDHTCITHLSTKPFSVGPNVIPLSAKTHAPYWTYYAVEDLQEFQEYRRHWMEFSIKETVLPSLELASVFDNQVKAIRALMESNEETSKTLARLRNTLLPKLISGELRSPEAEQLTEEALT